MTDINAALSDLDDFGIEVPSWAYGDMGNRFKVFGKEAHEIHAVNAFFRTFPKDLKRGWDSTDPVPAAAPWAAH